MRALAHFTLATKFIIIPWHLIVIVTQFMSSYLKKTYEIIDEFDDEYKLEICDYYFSLWKQKLENMDTVNNLSIVVLGDLKSIFGRYPFLNSEEFIEFEASVHKRKILEIRACILDLIDTDYSDNIETIYRPEKWVLEVVKELKTHFDLSDKEQLSVFRDFNDIFLEELGMIFLAKNKKFGRSGNQLILNFLFYKCFVERALPYDFGAFFESFLQNFDENKFQGFGPLEDILKSYLDAH